MIKVFLVEDEIIMRNGIKNNIPWEREGYAFVGDASDGELAYPLIKKIQPDILITDIRMPFMDGLELSALVKKEFPKIKIIILSGYGEFDYAKEAIRIGVTDYLLKPVSAKALLEAVAKVAFQIQKEREEEAMMLKHMQEMEENAVLEKQRLFNDVITNQIGFREMLERGGKLGLEFAASYYLVMLFKLFPVGNPRDYSKAMVECQQKVEERIQQEKEVLLFDRGVEGWALIFLGETREDTMEQAGSIEGILREIIWEYKGIEFFGGIGSVVERLNELQQSYLEASKAFAARFFTNSNQFIRYDELDMVIKDSNESLDIHSVDVSKVSQKSVSSFLKSGSKEEIDTFVEEYLKSVGEQNYRSLLFRQYVIINCYLAAKSFLEGLGMEEVLLSKGVTDVDHIIKDNRSMERVSYYLSQLFSEAMNLRDKQAEQKYAKLLGGAVEYIHNNYANEEISLNTVATQVNMSPSYFSSIFSQEMGYTFIEYLTDVRMEKARELLRCSNKKSTEIAYEVGYKDSHYFGYLFKKTMGCTPKEFRARTKED